MTSKPLSNPPTRLKKTAGSRLRFEKYEITFPGGCFPIMPNWEPNHLLSTQKLFWKTVSQAHGCRVDFKYIIYQDTLFIKLSMCTLSANLTSSLASISQLVTVPGTKWSSKVCCRPSSQGENAVWLLPMTSTDHTPALSQLPKHSRGPLGNLPPGQLWPQKECKGKAMRECLLRRNCWLNIKYLSFPSYLVLHMK